jgi:rubredoxin
MPEIDNTLVCVRCGRPARAEHHHPEKGMGGATGHVQVPDVSLCRECHSALHAKKFRLVVNGDFVSTVTTDGHVQSERALVVREDSPDPRYWSDAKLAMMIAQAMTRAVDMLLIAAQCAYEWQRRYGYGENWSERLSEFIRDTTGYAKNTAPRTLRGLAAQWPIFKDDPEAFQLLSGRIANEIVSDPNPKEAIELATVARLDGQPVQAVVETLRERQGKQPVESCTCPLCGCVHRRRST